MFVVPLERQVLEQILNRMTFIYYLSMHDDEKNKIELPKLLPDINAWAESKNIEIEVDFSMTTVSVQGLIFKNEQEYLLFKLRWL